LLQPSEPLLVAAAGILAKDEAVAVGADGAVGAPELYAGDDEAHHPQDEEHEGADDDDGGQQAALGDEPEQHGDVEDGEGGDGDEVGHVPGHAEAQDRLLRDKGREHAEDGAGGRQHDEHPDVELHRRPVVLVDALGHHPPLQDDRARARCVCGGHIVLLLLVLSCLFCATDFIFIFSGAGGLESPIRRVKVVSLSDLADLEQDEIEQAHEAVA
jgi:hypothetical protein